MFFITFHIFYFSYLYIYLLLYNAYLYNFYYILYIFIYYLLYIFIFLLNFYIIHLLYIFYARINISQIFWHNSSLLPISISFQQFLSIYCSVASIHCIYFTILHLRHINLHFIVRFIIYSLALKYTILH